MSIVLAHSQSPSRTALDDLAHEINVRLLKADDHRLSASLKLAEAKTVCKETGVSFKGWVLSEIKLGYFEAIRLAKIGTSDDPAKALADYREKTSARTKKSQGVEKPEQKVALISATLPPGRGRDAVCTRVREAISALTGLPPAAEVAAYFAGTDGAIVINDRLTQATTWLSEFADAWKEERNADGQD